MAAEVTVVEFREHFPPPAFESIPDTLVETRIVEALQYPPLERARGSLLYGPPHSRSMPRT